MNILCFHKKIFNFEAMIDIFYPSYRFINCRLKMNSSRPKIYLIQYSTNIFRYLEDTLALDKDDFSVYTKRIYPVELTLDKAYIKN